MYGYLPLSEIIKLLQELDSAKDKEPEINIELDQICPRQAE